MATSSNTLIATRSGEVLFIEKGSVLMNSQPMFITRHPRHRTGVHTCAVTTSSGTPGHPLKHSHNSHALAIPAGLRGKSSEKLACFAASSLTRVNPFFSDEKPGRRSLSSLSSTSGDFGKFISKSLARANPPLDES